MARKFKFYKQLETMDCGATCLRMIARYYGRYYSLEYLRGLTHQSVEGTSLLGISDAAEHLGMHTVGARLTFSRLIDDIPLPAIVHWRHDHFVVVIEANAKKVKIADPANGIHTLTKSAFLAGWVGDPEGYDREGIALLMEPTADFYARDGQKVSKTGFQYVWENVKKYPDLLWRVGLGMVLGGLLLVSFPFAVKALVDQGIDLQDYNLVLLIGLAWVMLFMSNMFLEIIRGILLKNIGSKVNMTLLTDFMMKLVKLPLRFFKTRMTSDIVQRLYDHTRVERFLTKDSFSVVFSGLILILFGVVLANFDTRIFWVFLFFSVVHIGWALLFLRKRGDLDYRQYDQAADTQAKLLDLVRGMEEIKLNNAEKKMRWHWEQAEAKLYRLTRRYLTFNDFPKIGARFINELKNIVIIVLAARAVIGVDLEAQVAAIAAGQMTMPPGGLPEPMTLGTMMAIVFIVAQLNQPINQIIDFILSAQDARISLRRMNEVHEIRDEESLEEKIRILPRQEDLTGENVSFQYDGSHSPLVLENLNFVIPYGKTTAIIGHSGSGKTTLLRLLTRLYPPTEGHIRLGEMDLSNIKAAAWRAVCGVVMQDGYIFSDTVAKNIALSGDIIHPEKLMIAAQVADLRRFIESLPRGFDTEIGAGGIGLSQGQRQRILIARAVYKQPEYLFLDEATNNIDPAGEATIMKNIRRQFGGKTVVVIAHKLSQAIHADHIIMMERGKIVERGTHDELSSKRGAYYRWLKEQWEWQ
ncbi:MAG: peptidase domain-containing ABC transporter [Bacteroidetes bacterium]|nr:MAG: peptidase domain-containing ABC transporter [Bacteroidota bacterium]